MKLFILFLALSLSFFSVMGSQRPGIETGASRTAVYVQALKGKRIGLVVNSSSRIGQTLLPDTLLSLGLHIEKIFAPEHGFRGMADAGAEIKNEKDAKTGLPVISLYGKHLMPSLEDLADIDIVVFDLQDVGARFYTYLSTLHYVMKACALYNKPLLVLDRPNPNGFSCDGPVLDTAAGKSFVGMHPVPITYGMTIGEYAAMINGEGWLGKGIKVNLKIVQLAGYTHASRYELPFTPSPNLPNANAIRLYPSLCLFEGTVISVGRGTEFPFQVYGHPMLSGYDFRFTPQSKPGKSTRPPLENELCLGRDLRTQEPQSGRVREPDSGMLNLSYLLEAYRRFPKKDHFFNAFFGKLAGTPSLRRQIESGFSESEIRKSWAPGLIAFKTMRKKYLLYP